MIAKIYRSLAFVSIPVFIAGCSSNAVKTNEHASSSMTVVAPNSEGASAASIDSEKNVPSDWKYVSCPNFMEVFHDCDFLLPVPPKSDIDFERSTQDFWISGLDEPASVIFEKWGVSAANSAKQFQDLLTCKSGIHCPVIDYVANINGIQVARRRWGKQYGFLILTPKMLINVLDPSYKQSPGITDENVSTLEITLLNLKLK